MDRFYSSPSHQPDEPWFRVGTVDVNTTILLCGVSVISMLVWAVSPRAVAELALWPSDVRRGELWRLVTWPIATGASFQSVLDVLMMFIFGREIERSLGRTRFAVYAATIVVVTGVAATFLDVASAGLFLLSTAMFLAFVAAYPRAIGFFGIPLWVFGAVFLGIEILQYIGGRDWHSLIVILIVCAFGLLGARSFGLSELDWIPKVPLPAALVGPGGGRPGRGRKPQRRHAGRGSRRGSGEVIAMRPPNATPTSAELLRQAEIDILLDKINEHGIGSLTAEERRRLDEHSRRMRDER